MNTGSDSSRFELMAGLGLSVAFAILAVVLMVEAAGNGETGVIVVGGLVGTWWLIKGLHSVRLLRNQS